MTTSKLIKREVVDYEINKLPYDENESGLKDPSSVRIKLSIRKHPFDIGALAYTKRTRPNKNPRSSDYATFMVDTKSLREDRLIALNNFFESIYTSSMLGNRRDKTLSGIMVETHKFVDWCDKNNFQNALESAHSARLAFEAYNRYFEEKVKFGLLLINTGATYVRSALDGIAMLMGIDKVILTNGLRYLRYNDEAKKSTEPPKQEDTAKLLPLCSHIFDGLTDLVTNEKEFPFQLKLPHESVWVIPAVKMFVAKEKLKYRDRWTTPSWAWDFENGTINDPKDIENKYHNAKTKRERNSRARVAVYRSTNQLSHVNSNKRSATRLDLAYYAHSAFILMFFANTGMNESPAFNLGWNDDYIIGKEHQKYRTIKFRNKGEEQEFIVTSKFLPKFNQFLELRKYLLNGRPYPFLFLRLNEKREPTFSPCSRAPLNTFIRMLKANVDSDVTSILSRKWRANKSDYLIKSKDTAIAALMLQNNEKTIIKSYAKGCSTTAGEEMSAFFKKVNDRVFLKGQSDDHQPSSVGHCDKYGDPVPDSASPPVTPDCRQPEGCLFCEHYAVHADEEDIRKLCSVRYVINETMHLAHSIDHHIQMFDEVMQRITYVLESVSNISTELKKLVIAVKNDVEENENLDTYWENKLNMMCEIGAL